MRNPVLLWTMVITLPLWLSVIWVAAGVFLVAAWVVGVVWLLISMINEKLLKINSTSGSTIRTRLGMYVK